MYVLLNPVDIAEPLAQQMLIQQLKKDQPIWSSTAEYINKCTKRTSKTGLLDINFAEINNFLKLDLQQHLDQTKIWYKKNYRPATNWLAERLDRIDPHSIQWAMQQIGKKSLLKAVGHQLCATPTLIKSASKLDLTEPMLIRNVLHNEKVIAKKIKNNLPFWFIDSGYTNFLTPGRKSWHRLVRNHIHHAVPNVVFPADRLHLLPSFPKAWRQGGTEILVVENSEHHYRMFGTSVESWRNTIAQQIAKFSDRPVRFRPKSMDRKNRESLYELLLNGDFYCVITDASAASIEAIWAGVPVITLNQHVSTPVCRTTIADIENLYRGCVGNWLCALSYHQFTAKEFLDGTALDIMTRHYHA